MRTKIKVAVGIIVVVVVIAVALVVLGGRLDEQETSQFPMSRSVNSSVVDGKFAAPMMALDNTAPGDVSEVGGSPVAKQEQKKDDRMIVRSGALSVVTKDVRKSVEEVSSFVASIGGFVVSSEIEGTADNPSATLSVRVPVDKFQESLDKAKSAGIRVTSESATGQDVTEDFTDTQARIKNLQASEAQFMEIMTRAQKISDVLEVQTQLERVRGEIEVAQGHAQYLEKSAKLSSITIYFAIDEGQLPVVDPSSVWSPSNIVKSAFRVLVNIAELLGSLIIWSIVFIPLWIIIGLVVYLSRRFIRRKTGRV